MARRRGVPRETVAIAGASACPDGIPRRRGRGYSASDLAVIAKLQNLRAEGMTITNREIAQALGRSESGLKSKLSRLKAVKPYRRVGPGLPGRKPKDGGLRRRRREDRVVPRGLT